MSCRLCLRELQLFIYVFDKHGQDNYGIAAVVAKCLSVKLTLSSADRDKVCLQCWSILRKFHMFCQEIEEKQSELERSLITTKGVDDENDVPERMETQVPSMEAQVPDDIINANSEYYENENQKPSKSTTDIPDTRIELTEPTTDIPDTGIELTEPTMDDENDVPERMETQVPGMEAQVPDDIINVNSEYYEIENQKPSKSTTDILDTGIELTEPTMDDENDVPERMETQVPAYLLPIRRSSCWTPHAIKVF